MASHIAPAPAKNMDLSPTNPLRHAPLRVAALGLLSYAEGVFTEIESHF